MGAKSEHVAVELRGKALKARCRKFTFEKSKLPPQSKVLKDDNKPQEPLKGYFIAINPGEYFCLSNAVWLKVIKGAVEINGHIYTVRTSDFRKFIIPPWEPAERVMALCLNVQKDAASKHDGDSTICTECENIITRHFFGGGCCSIVQEYQRDLELVESFFKGKIANSPRKECANAKDETPDPIAAELFKLYKSKGPVLHTAVVALVNCRSVFGTVAVKSCLNPQKPLKLIPRQFKLATQEILRLCKGDEKKLPVLVLFGDLGSGKSTSIRFIANYLLNFMDTVALIDCDIGQPQIGAPGMVTMTFLTEAFSMPPHAHISHIKPDHVGIVGNVSVRKTATILRHVHRFMQVYMQRLDSNFRVPLIVNTFGWTTGLGLYTLQSVISICNAAVVLAMVTKWHQHLGTPTSGGSISTSASSRTEAIETHSQLDARIDSLFTIQPDPDDNVAPLIDTAPGYNALLHELGVAAPHDASSYKTSKAPSHVLLKASVSDLIASIMSSQNPICGLQSWGRLVTSYKMPKLMPFDQRWLRVSTYFNPSFGDAMHFVPLSQDEYFGPVETPHFNYYIRNKELFNAPRQKELYIDKLHLVLPLVGPGNHFTLEQVSTHACGSVGALCRGEAEGSISHNISDHWEFFSYVYVHYIDTESTTALVSYPSHIPSEHLDAANILMLCPTVGFDLLPPRLSNYYFYPSIEVGATPRVSRDHFQQPRRYSTSQGIPFRRNGLVHLVGSRGAGTSAPSNRPNVKRHHQK